MMALWQECESMDHVGPVQDATVHWRELGLMCDACFAAFGDLRVAEKIIRDLVEQLDPSSPYDQGEAVTAALHWLRGVGRDAAGRLP